MKNNLGPISGPMDPNMVTSHQKGRIEQDQAEGVWEGRLERGIEPSYHSFAYDPNSPESVTYKRRMELLNSNEPAQEKGYVHIYAGDGKGKTTAATGLTLRAASRGWRILFIQFLKSGESAELDLLRALPNVNVVSGQTIQKFTFAMNDEEKKACNEEMQSRLDNAIAHANDYDLIVLDEALGALSTCMIDEDSLVNFLQNRPPTLEVVLTGRDPSERLIKHADYYSEVCMRKHPYETEGLQSRPGIEY